MIEALPEQTGLSLNRKVLLYGFSRGGQVAHRFALAFPDRVLGVASLAAGTYTLPDSELTIDGRRRSLPLPYGTADLAQRLEVTIDRAALRHVGFWLAVGANDTREGDVPAAWTTYIGPHRLARARAFKAALDRLGAPADLVIFPNIGHDEAAEMRQAACRYLGRLPGQPTRRSSPA
jgi:pimeloyl-ACP methyl ester carboxylesterase